MPDETWASFGIDDETRFEELLFEPISQILIAHFYRELENEYRVKSLYARHISETRYRRLTEKSDKLSFECAKLSHIRPHLYVNVLEICESEGKPYGYNWNSIRQIDIESNEVVCAVTAGDLILDEPYYDGWVRNILGAAADGSNVYCSVGMSRRTSTNSSVVDYHLAELSLVNRKPKLINKLDAVFF